MASAMNMTVNIPESCADTPANRFWVKGKQDEVQVRLDGDDDVYLCYTENNRIRIKSVNVSWEIFEEEFRKMVDQLVK